MNKPIFIISDLHIGSGGPRDSFSQYNRCAYFENFLNYVEKEDGELIILGDFIDLWRFSFKKVVKARRDLLDRLAEMKVCCVPGNHDLALNRFINSQDVPHPFFKKIKEPFVRIIGDKKFSFLHGHELDPMNRNLTHRVGRILGLSSSLVEYAKGYPVFSSDVIEETLLSIEEKLFLFWLNFVRQLANFTGLSGLPTLHNAQVLPRQKRIEKLLLKYELKKQIDGNDITISAHTHRACRFQEWYFNSGSWTDQTNNFIQILPDGKVNIFDWEKDTPRYNNTIVYSSPFTPTFKTGYIIVNCT